MISERPCHVALLLPLHVAGHFFRYLSNISRIWLSLEPFEWDETCWSPTLDHFLVASNASRRCFFPSRVLPGLCVTIWCLNWRLGRIFPILVRSWSFVCLRKKKKIRTIVNSLYKKLKEIYYFQQIKSVQEVRKKLSVKSGSCWLQAGQRHFVPNVGQQFFGIDTSYSSNVCPRYTLEQRWKATWEFMRAGRYTCRHFVRNCSVITERVFGTTCPHLFDMAKLSRTTRPGCSFA